MFDYIQGKLTQASTNKVTLEAGGIGYCLFISLSTFEKLPPCRETVKLFTSLVVREDSQKIYGFTKKEERDLFETLIGISGIGPRIALSLLGHMNPEDLLSAIENENTPVICRVPGIGKKMAQRLILELRDQWKKNAKHTHSLSPSKAQGPVQDAIHALIHLGYSPLDAQKAVKKAIPSSEEELPLSELIGRALKSRGSIK